MSEEEFCYYTLQEVLIQHPEVRLVDERAILHLSGMTQQDLNRALEFMLKAGMIEFPDTHDTLQ